MVTHASTVCTEATSSPCEVAHIWLRKFPAGIERSGLHAGFRLLVHMAIMCRSSTTLCSTLRTANSVRASLLKPCRPDRRSAAGDIIARAGIAGAGDVPRPGSSIFSPRPIRNKKTRAWLTTAPRVASPPGRAAPYREPADSSRSTSPPIVERRQATAAKLTSRAALRGDKRIGGAAILAQCPPRISNSIKNFVNG